MNSDRSTKIQFHKSTMKKNHKINLWLLLLICFLQNAVFSQTYKSEVGNLFVTNYSRSFLNAAITNWSVLQDRDGIIYIGNNSEGILIYDGQSIRKVLNEKGLPQYGFVRAIISDAKHTIYAEIDGNFGYIEKNEFGESIYHSLSNTLPKEDEVKSNLWGAEVYRDTVFFQSEKAIYLYKFKKLLKVIKFDNITHSLSKNPDGIFLRVWGKGFYKFEDGNFKLIPSSKNIFSDNRIDGNYLLNNGNHLLISRNIGLWYLKKDGSLVKANSKLLDDYAIKGSAYISSDVLKNGIIPMTTNSLGMVFFDQNLNIKAVLNNNNGLKFDHITNYIQDREGDLWATSDNVFKTSFDTTITYFSTMNGLYGDVGGISRIHNRLYVRTGNELYDFVPKTTVDGISKFEKNNVNDLGSEIVEFNDQIITTNNYTIKSTKNRVTTIVSKVYRSTKSIRSKLNPSLLFSSNYAYGLLVHQYKNGKWKQIPLISKDTILCWDAFEPEAGKMILATKEGPYLYSYTADGQGTYTKMEKDKSFTKSDIGNLKILNNNYLVHDTANNFYSIDLDKKMLHYTGANLDSIIGRNGFSYSYNPTSKNGWMISTKGLYKIKYDSKSGFEFKQYPFYKVDLTELSTGLYAEGIGEKEVLWIGSQDDKLYRYYPELAIKEKHQTFNALIRAISSNGQKLSLNLNKLSFNKNNLIFEVAYPVFGNESKTTFSYWLEGQDKTWTPYLPDFKKEYTNLKEGNYVFHVRAMDASGGLSEEGKTEFIISPPWYRTLLAYGMYLIAGIICFILFGKFQAKKSFLKAEHERKNSELAAAKDLQNRLLPKVVPSIKGLDIAGFLRTSTEVGGDYYDFFEQADGSLYAMCGDATGHGTPSGMLVSITKAGLIGMPEMEPKEMLRELNRVVKKVDLGILRMSLNIVHIKDDELTLSSAGMPPYYIYRANSKTTEEIMLSGIPLGSFNNVHYDQLKTSFHTGDILVIISDGLPEAPNLESELFDYTKVQQLISENGDESADGIIKKLIVEADLWLAGKQNPDDITLVVIKHL